MRTSRPGRSASGCVRSCLGAAGCAAELATNCAALHVATADAIAAAVATVTYDATGRLLRVNMDRSSRLSPDRQMNVFPSQSTMIRVASMMHAQRWQFRAGLGL